MATATSTQLCHRAAMENPLISKIVNGEDGRDIRMRPFEVAGYQRTLPIVGMDEICRPGFVYAPARDLGRGVREGRKTNVVVVPVNPTFVTVR